MKMAQKFEIIRHIDSDIEILNSEIAEIKVRISILRERLKYERPPYGNPDEAYCIERDIQYLMDLKDYAQKRKAELKTERGKIYSKNPKKSEIIIVQK
jgi:hypothetical protein